MRWQWIALVPLAVLSAALESLGAAVVFALIKILNDPSQMTALPLAAELLGLFPATDETSIIQFSTFLVVLFYLFKNGLVILATYWRNRLVSYSIAACAQDLFERYLKAPYSFHFRRNSAELIRNTTDSSDVAYRLFMSSAFNVSTESLVVIGISALLMLAAPVVTLIAMGCLFFTLLALLRLTRSRFTRWGRQEQELKKAVLQHLQQSLNGVKEIKLRGREPFFFQTFSELQQGLARLRIWHLTLALVPRLLVETVFVCGMLLVIILITMPDRAGLDIIPLLGLYAYAGFRIIPSVNRILENAQYMRYGTAAVEQLHNDFRNLASTSTIQSETGRTCELSFAERIVLEGVYYHYDLDQKPVLQDIHVSIQHGESIGIVGATGAGKSTLLDLILGLLSPSKGRITVDGKDIHKHLRSWQRKIGYVPQDIYLIDDSLRRNIAFGLDIEEIDENRIQAAVVMAQLKEVISSRPEGLNALVAERGIRLSGGQRQRVAIARALYHEPELLIFDEATSALDPQTETEVTQAIQALHGKKTMIIVAHRLSTVRFCDRLVFLKHGRIEGCAPFDELIRQNKAFRDMVSNTSMLKFREDC